MSLLNNLKTKDTVKALDQDRLGGSRLLATDVYAGNIKYAYLSQADSGAIAINFQAETDDKQLINQTTYMTSRTGSNTYVDKQSGEDRYLPGFILGNSLALLTVGDEIGNLTVEEKVINLYNFDEKKELPTKVQMLSELIGQRAKFAVEQQIQDKNVKNDAGKYVASGETREVNEVTKVFRDRDNMTVTEIQERVEDAVFMDLWVEKNKGEVINKAKGAATGGAKSGAPTKAGAGASKAGGVKSLFN
ncbi:hypothetical protein IT774_07735 [Salinimonas marina]|uniref:Uncharacterized protein n=1 Tax=Salinimonas marina TaxID=2785918 RepID=A0A7S9DZV2_9ALTE|nr:hypothetical protein [Salinimonas marina]QPG06986.1 hypothetical protein IT774_07735 [Salinimonas marina]